MYYNFLNSLFYLHLVLLNLFLFYLLQINHNFFFEKLDNILDSNPRFEDEVGMIGFCDYNQIEVGKPLYGRGELIKGINEIGRGWYQDLPQENELECYFLWQLYYE